MKGYFLQQLFFAGCTLASIGSQSDTASVANKSAVTAKPNIIFMLTDDQDTHLGSLEYMQGVQTHLINEGALYENHFCTVALCCPSRANLWTGRAAHNTNVTALTPPYGGYPKFIEGGFNDDWLPVWLQNAGYQTYMVGKLMNSFDPDNYNKPFINGFNGSDLLCGSATYNYFNPMYQRNKDPPVTYKNQYTTDLLWNKSMGFLDDARKSRQPFFLIMAPVAPHVGYGPRPAGVSDLGPVPKAEYASYFSDVQVPRTSNFNPDRPSGSNWLLNLKKQSQADTNAGDEHYRNRLRALQSVDELVNNTISYLSQHNLLETTYIIYSSDNGFHIGQHRLYPGKRCPYEEDINIPLIIRGPGITAGRTINVATTHTDLAPTILNLAQVPLPNYLDGAVVPPIDPSPDAQSFEHAQIEHWGAAADEDVIRNNYPDIAGVQNNTYKSLRVIGKDYNYAYTVWCTNQKELYDISSDPQQMNNLFEPIQYTPSEPQNTNWTLSINRLESRLNALLLVLKSCKATTCHQPWSALHPQGDVSSLLEAMDSKYDEFYEKQQKRVSFSWCAEGYILAAEGPQTFHQYEINRLGSSLLGF